MAAGIAVLSLSRWLNRSCTSAAGNVVTHGLQAAAAAAERARAAAEAARAQADSAQAIAAAVARELLTSKRAEIEAAEMLEKTKNPKDADPAAAEILKVGSCLHPNQA